jgi:hypothetical protein
MVQWYVFLLIWRLGIQPDMDVEYLGLSTYDYSFFFSFLEKKKEGYLFSLFVW